MSLFEHHPHPHKPVNVNVQHQSERQGINDKIAIVLTNGVASMWCAYAFAILAILGFPGLHASPTQWVQWISQTLIQLVMLSVIMVGQKVLGRHQEIQSEEQFNTTKKIFEDILQIMQHLSKQDDELIAQSKMIKAILETMAARP
jgi:hypothetical protein